MRISISTHTLARRVTRAPGWSRSVLSISTHTLARRVTRQIDALKDGHTYISTHTLARRVTASTTSVVGDLTGFQPTPSHGG